MQVKYGTSLVTLRLYKFPARGQQTEDYHLFLGKDKLGTDRVRTTTGGGKSFTYIKTDEQAKNGDQSWWCEGVIPSGTKIELIANATTPAAKVDPVQTKPAPKAAKESKVTKPVLEPELLKGKAPTPPATPKQRSSKKAK